RLRRELERVHASMARSSLMAAAGSLPCEQEAAALARLLEAEVDPELAREILEASRQRKMAGGVPFLEAVSAELASRCPVDPRLGRRMEGPRVVAVIGPSGAGKTTLLAKLAVREGLTRRQSVELVSLDFCRVGGAEQLRQFAAILGAPFQAIETRHGLEQALRDSQRKDLVLIDTPGLGAGEQEEARELASWLEAQAEPECWLVLTASMRSADLWRVAERFERFRPRKLVFTRLDETTAIGALWSLAVRLGRPVAFLSAGQRIPEDIEPATSARLVEWLGFGLARWAAGAAA
ncbi:MAG: AAA family ATPase, partial [Bryobacteraceae bacterium]